MSTAEAAGYARLPAPAPLHECIDTDVDLDDRDGKPAMGIHWVNGALLDGTVDVRKPEVLVYEPKRNGKLQLVALEYVVFEADWGAHGTRPAPKLFGQEFMYVAAPNRYDLPAFYALHAWVWKNNPDGVLEADEPVGQLPLGREGPVDLTQGHPLLATGAPGAPPPGPPEPPGWPEVGSALDLVVDEGRQR